MDQIAFYYEDIQFRISDEPKMETWVRSLLNTYQKDKYRINYIFCNDNYLLEINKDFLSHDYLTDIITFNNSDNTENLESDIFISIDRVSDNAQINNEQFEKELIRVMAHGILHLVGYNDKSPDETKVMRSKEDEAITMYYA